MLIDAHNHLQDERLKPDRDAIIGELHRSGIGKWVVNGTSQIDWSEVAKLAEDFPREVVPCFGLHPWFIRDRTDAWESELGQYLDRFPGAGVGEIGLDRWIRDHRIDEQEILFRHQLALAAARNRPAMIHCLKAWGRLLDVLKDEALPECGFLLHSFTGPAEMIDSFAELGGYFSFSGYFLEERKQSVRDAFRRVPLDRLLIESDAPDMKLPEKLDQFGLRTATGERINHPANLAIIYENVDEWLDIEPETLTDRVRENFDRLLGKGAT